MTAASNDNKAQQVRLHFFASLREALNCSELEMDLAPGIVTVGQLRAALIARDAVWAAALAEGKPLRMAYQQTMCDAGQTLDPSAPVHEVAFFPPVTGG